MKKILLSLLLVTVLFTFTGCGSETSSDNLHKQEFVDMRYNEPKNYSKKQLYDMGNAQTLVYFYNEDNNKSINLYYNSNTAAISIDEDYEEVTINGVKWKKFRDTAYGVNVVYDTYEVVYNNGLYRIELNVVDKYKEEFDEFLKDVSFN